MKRKNLLSVAVVLFLFSGCVVFSFYPLYTEKDLFANDLLLGKWIDGDSTIWNFEYHYKGKKLPENIDSTAYVLRLREKDSNQLSEAELLVHVIQLDEHYFLDFYLKEYGDKNSPDLFDFHMLPVHTFAKLIFKNDSTYINWFDQGWLSDLIEENRIRIHHESNDDHILLTARPQELQKFVRKYVNSEEAFKDGLNAQLRKLK